MINTDQKLIYADQCKSIPNPRKSFILKTIIVAGFVLALLTLTPSTASAATATWTNGGADGLWATCGNWSGGTGAGGCPGTGDVATFDNTSTANATIAAGTAVSVSGVNIQSTYSGTITQTTTATITMGADGWTQAGGTFTGGSGAIAITVSNPNAFTFSLTGGTFTSTSGSFTLTDSTGGGAFTINGGTFNHSNGTVAFRQGCCGGTTVTLTGSTSFYNLSFVGSCCTNGSWTIASGTTVTVLNTLTLNLADFANSGDINVQGNISLTGYGAYGNVNINIVGSGDQTITGASGGLSIPKLIINKPSGNLTFVDRVNIGNGLTYTAGNLVTTGSTIGFRGGGCGTQSQTITGSITLNNVIFFNSDGYCNSTTTIASGTTVTATGTLTIQRTTGARPLTVNGPGTIVAQGDVIADTGDAIAGNAPITMSGTADQTLTQNSNFPTGTFTINKPSGTVTLGSAVNLSGAGQDLVFSSGTLNMSTYGLTVNDVFTLGGNLTQTTGNVSAGTYIVSRAGVWNNASTGDITIGSGGVANNGTMNFGTLASCGGSDNIAITSSSGGTARNWNGTGTYAFYDVNLTDQNETPKLGHIIAYSSTASNSNFIATSSCPTPPVLSLSFNEGTGTVANDSSTFKNNGTISGATWVTEDRCAAGKCLNFSSSNSAKVTVGSSVAQVNSVAFWVNPKSTTESIIDLDGGSHTITVASGTIAANGFSSPTIYVDGKISSTLTNNKWQYVEVTTNTAITASSVKIGYDNSTYFNGFIDEFKLYNYIRSGAQVKTDYNARGARSAAAQIGSSDAWLSKGLVGYWKLDETATPSLDSSGNGSSGTWNGNAAAGAGKFGNGISLDGTGDYISAGTSTTLDVTTNFTFSTWVKLGATSLTNIYILNKRSASTLDNYAMIYGFNADKFEFYADTNSYTGDNPRTALTTNVDDTNWHLITWTYDGKTVKGYLDGALDVSSTKSFTLGTAASTFRIGTSDTTANFWSGTIDEVRVYNRTLSPKEVSDLYSFAPGPVGYWKLDEKTGTSASDSSGNGSTGTLTNSPTWTNGKFSGGLSFDGVNDYVTGTLSSSLANSSFTVGAWTYMSAAPISNTAFSLGSNGSQNNGLHIRLLTNGAVRCGFWNNDLDTAASAYSSGSWRYVACSFDAGTKKRTIYVDGVAVTSDTSASNFTGDTTFTIGVDSWLTNADLFSGKIDDVKVYNYVRSAKQIVEDMQGVSSAGISSKSVGINLPVGYWKLDEGQGTTGNDSSGNSNSLTLSSASWTNSGKFGKAWNGTGALWLSRDDDSDFDFLAAEDLSLSLWFKSDSAANPGANEYLIDKGTTVGYSVFADTNGKLNFSVFDGTNTDTATTNSDLYDGTWHHIVASKTGTSKIEIYVDGKFNTADSSIAATGTLVNSGLLYIGDKDGTDNGDEFNGDLDEVKVYRYALTSDEVKTEFNRGAALNLSSLGNNATYQPNAGNQEYCVPGDSSACNPPVGEWKFDEKRGQTANDTSGNGYNGTLTNGPTWINGKFSGALKFDSTNDFVNMGNSTSLGADGDWTLEAWVYPENMGGSNAYPRVLEKYPNNKRLILEWQASSGKFRVDALQDYSPGSDAETRSAYSINPNTWTHIAATHNATTKNLSVYINGVLDNTSQTTATGNQVTDANTAYFFAAGAEYDGYNPAWLYKGKIDEAKFFNYARTPAQVAWDYNKGKPVGWWKFDECTGTTLNDSSGNNNTGTWNGTSAGSQTSAGNCTTSGSTAWYSGRTGKRNYSLNFDGTDDYVDLGTSSSLQPSNALTVAAWVKRDSSLANFSGIFSSQKQNNEGGYILVGTSTNKVRFYLDPSPAGGSDWVYAESDSALTSGQWYHLVGTWDGTTVKLYIDGVLQTTTGSTSTIGYSTNGTHNHVIGLYVTDNWPGQIDDVRIYNYALTPTQVKQVMNDGAVRFGPSSGTP